MTIYDYIACIALALSIAALLLLRALGRSTQETDDRLDKKLEGYDNMRSERHYALDREFRQARSDLDELATLCDFEWREEPRKLKRIGR